MATYEIKFRLANILMMARYDYRRKPTKENKEALEEAQREWHEYLETRL